MLNSFLALVEEALFAARFSFKRSVEKFEEAAKAQHMALVLQIERERRAATAAVHASVIDEAVSAVVVDNINATPADSPKKPVTTGFLFREVANFIFIVLFWCASQRMIGKTNVGR